MRNFLQELNKAENSDFIFGMCYKGDDKLFFFREVDNEDVFEFISIFLADVADKIRLEVCELTEEEIKGILFEIISDKYDAEILMRELEEKIQEGRR